MNIVEETRCRVCGGNLKEVLSLGKIYPSDFLAPDEKVSEDQKAPLTLAECEDCGLVQLKHTVDLDMMYRQYWYASSLNKSMVSSLQDVVEDVINRMKLKRGDVVLDIGCNDGTLLGMYSKEVRAIGFDPAKNIHRHTFMELVEDYFNAEAYLAIPEITKAKIITAIAMFYDLPDPHKFVEDVATVLDGDGIFVIQFTDLLSMIRVTAFDNICHEHLEYYTLRDVKYLLETHGLEVIDASYNNVNGGSLRVIASHENKYAVSDNVSKYMTEEADYLKTHGLDYFAKNIETTKFKVKEYLKWAELNNQTTFLMGASTKGNTLLQVCEIDCNQIPFVAEVNAEKFGLRTVGSNIEIISEEEALIKHPHAFLVPVWHFKHSLLSNPKIMDYLRANGRLIFPLPYFHIVFADYNGNAQEVRI